MMNIFTIIFNLLREVLFSIMQGVRRWAYHTVGKSFAGPVRVGVSAFIVLTYSLNTEDATVISMWWKGLFMHWQLEPNINKEKPQKFQEYMVYFTVLSCLPWQQICIEQRLSQQHIKIDTVVIYSWGVGPKGEEFMVKASDYDNLSTSTFPW